MTIGSPWYIRVADAVISTVGIVCLLNACGTVTTGMFSGPHVFFPGGVLACLGLVSVVAVRRIQRQHSSAVTAGAVWGGGALLTAVIVVSTLCETTSEMVGGALLLGVPSLFVMVVFLLPSTRQWFSAGG